MTKRLAYSSPFGYRMTERSGFMTKLLVASIFFVALTAITSARIGESEAQLTTRYGKSIGDVPTQAFGTVRGFLSQRYLVGVAFVNGVSDMEMFSKADQSELTPQELEDFMKFHGEGIGWRPFLADQIGWKRWHRQDGAMVALYDVNRHFLYVCSQKFFAAQGKKLEAKEPKKGP